MVELEEEIEMLRRLIADKDNEIEDKERQRRQ